MTKQKFLDGDGDPLEVGVLERSHRPDGSRVFVDIRGAAANMNADTARAVAAALVEAADELEDEVDLNDWTFKINTLPPFDDDKADWEIAVRARNGIEQYLTVREHGANLRHVKALRAKITS